MEWIRQLLDFFKLMGISKYIISFIDDGEVGCGIYVSCTKNEYSIDFTMYDGNDEEQNMEMIVHAYKNKEKIFATFGSAKDCLNFTNKQLNSEQELAVEK